MIRQITTWLFFFFLTYINAAQGQSFAVFEKKFTLGKEQFEQKNFAAAVESFKSAMQNHPNNTYVVYASFFCALSHFELLQYADSKVILAKITENYPKWTQIEDVQYWYALCQFELGFTADAMKLLTGLEKNYSFFNISQIAKKQFLPRAPYEQLRFLYLTYPNDRALAECLADKNMSFSEGARDKILLADIKTKFGYTPSTTQTVKENPSAKPENSTVNSEKTAVSYLKPTYNVALLLPLNLSEFETDNIKRKNQYLMDLYLGAKIAEEEINRNGKKINLFFYDTERDAGKIKNILSPEEVRKIDLLLGPVTASGFQSASKIIAENAPQLAHFHPFASYSELTEGKNNTFLFECSYKAQASAASKIMIDSLLRKKAYIIYGETRSDSVLAHHYKAAVEKKGGKIELFMQYKTANNSFRKLQEQLIKIAPEPPKLSEKDKKELTPEEILEKTKPKEDSSAHIAVFTTQQALAINAASIVRISQIDIPMVVNKEWLSFEQVGFENFNDKRIFILHPSLPNTASEFFTPFVTEFLARSNFYPSEYAFIGYEMMAVLGRELIENGTNFAAEMQKKSFVPGKIMFKHNFSGSQFNNIAPILQYKAGLQKIIVY
jgi:hypothetical protein